MSAPLIIKNPSGILKFSGSVSINNSSSATLNSGSNIGGVFNSGSSFTGSLSGSTFTGSFGSGSTFTGSFGSGSYFSGSFGTGSTFSGSFGSGSYFSGSFGSGSNFTGSLPSGSYLSGSILIPPNTYTYSGSLTSSINFSGSFSGSTIFSGSFPSSSQYSGSFGSGSHVFIGIFDSSSVFTGSFGGGSTFTGSLGNANLTASFISVTFLNGTITSNSSYSGSFTSSHLNFSGSNWVEVHAHNCPLFVSLDLSNSPFLTTLDIVSCQSLESMFFDYDFSLTNITVSNNTNLLTMSFAWSHISSFALSNLLIQMYNQSFVQNKPGVLIATGSFTSSLTHAGQVAWHGLLDQGWKLPTSDHPDNIPPSLYRSYLLQNVLPPTEAPPFDSSSFIS